MNAAPRIAIVLLTAALSAAAPSLGFAAGTRLTRAQALARLSDADAAQRLEAVARLGEVGTMGDAQALVKELRDPDEDVRTGAEEALWKVWQRSGDAKVDALYRRGLKQMSAGSAGQALATFTRVIRLKPQFAEAWNKRATLYFLTGDYEKSLADCNEVMKRNPYHFGALAGYFQIYVQLEEFERALRYGHRALAINPNMDQLREGVESIEQMLGISRQVI